MRVVLSHAHIDHSGRLPYLIAEGYSQDNLATAGDPGSVCHHACLTRHTFRKGPEFLAKRKKESSSRCMECDTQCARWI